MNIVSLNVDHSKLYIQDTMSVCRRNVNIYFCQNNLEILTISRFFLFDGLIDMTMIYSY